MIVYMNIWTLYIVFLCSFISGIILGYIVRLEDETKKKNKERLEKLELEMKELREKEDKFRLFLESVKSIANEEKKEKNFLTH